MSNGEPFLDQVVAWAMRDPNVRRLVLVGSRASRVSPDDLADFDLQVHVETSEPYTRHAGWMAEIGQAWLCMPDEYSEAGLSIPTRLVIFEGGVKVDFAFYPVGIASEGVRAGLAHRILLNKDATLYEGPSKPADRGRACCQTRRSFAGR